MKTPIAILVGAIFLVQLAGAQDRPARAIPVSPSTEESAPAATPVAEPVDEEKKDILVSDREKDLYEYADLAYTRGFHDLSVQQFSGFLNDFPKSKLAEAAWYKLGDSYLNLKKTDKAFECFSRVVRDYKGGTYVPTAAYRAASIRYLEQNHAVAEPLFALANQTTTHAEIRLSSMYYRGICLDNMGKKKEAIAAFETVTKTKESNRFLEGSLLFLGRAAVDDGKKEAALAYFKELSTVAANADVKAEAFVKAGLIASSLNQLDDAEALLKQSLTVRGGDSWKAEAQFYLVKALYEKQDYAGVISAYNSGGYGIETGRQATFLLLVGNALAKQNRMTSAVDLYLKVEERFPESPEALEAGYRKLLCLQTLKAPLLANYARDYINGAKLIDPKHKFIDLAALMLAESEFAAEDYEAAARSYEEINLESLPEDIRASMLYKTGWAQSEAGRNAQAIRSLSQFLELYPEDPRVPNAIAQRGFSYKAVEDLNGAKKDFQRLLSEFPKHSASEAAHQQIARINAQQRDYDGMIAAYQGLLTNFPETKAAADAWFWIGWAHYEKGRFEEAIPPLTKAREFEDKEHFDQCSLRLVLANFSLLKVDETLNEVEKIESAKRSVNIPADVYAWLGVNLFDRQEYKQAARFLTTASDPDDPTSTKPVIWRALGEAQLALEQYESAIASLDHYLATKQTNEARARVLNSKAKALMALELYEEAEKTVASGLEIQKQGRVNADLCLTWGDIALRQKQWEEALKRLVRPAFIFEDQAITPMALEKSAYAHERLGQEEKGAELRAKIKKQFPQYGAPVAVEASTETAPE